MSVEEAIRKLDELGTDNEVSHAAADDVLLALVDPAVQDAYRRANERCGGFWYGRWGNLSTASERSLDALDSLADQLEAAQGKGDTWERIATGEAKTREIEQVKAGAYALKLENDQLEAQLEAAEQDFQTAHRGQAKALAQLEAAQEVIEAARVFTRIDDMAPGKYVYDEPCVEALHDALARWDAKASTVGPDPA